MKKYAFGIMAIVLAIGFSAFTTRPNRTIHKGDLLVFTYTQSTFTEDKVEDIGNWVFDRVYDESSSCSNDDHKACELVVDESKTTGGANPELDIPIVSAQFDTDIFYVTEQPSGVDIALNKQ